MREGRTIAADYVVLASSPADEISLATARRFIDRHGWTADDVKIMKGTSICVIAKREIKLKETVYETNI